MVLRRIAAIGEVVAKDLGTELQGALFAAEDGTVRFVTRAQQKHWEGRGRYDSRAGGYPVLVAPEQYPGLPPVGGLPPAPTPMSVPHLR